MTDFEPIELIDEPHIMVVLAETHKNIGEELLRGALAVINKKKATYEIVRVPSVFDIPAPICYAMRGLDFYTARKRFDAYVVLGCAIRGETNQYDIITQETYSVLQELACQYTIALGSGIITANTEEQAVVRAGIDKRNEGGVAAENAFSMLKLKEYFGIYPRK